MVLIFALNLLNIILVNIYYFKDYLNLLLINNNFYIYSFMQTYEGWVRVPISSSGSGTRPIKVQVEANSVADAVGMLRGQYGPENVIGFPTKVND